jgi:2-haloacid dehalogenase
MRGAPACPGLGVVSPANAGRGCESQARKISAADERQHVKVAWQMPAKPRGGLGVGQIDCVVFDIGNVLVRWDPRNLYRRLGYADPETAAILAEVGLLEINHRILDAGGQFAATLELLVERFPQRAQFIRAFDARWADLLGGPIEANVAILKRLKQAGVPVHAISNFNRPKFDIARNLFPFLNAFDELVLSGDVGLVKPDPAIFELLIHRRGLDVRRTVFIDDTLDNIAAATKLGFATIHFREAHTDLTAELLRLGLQEQLI